MRRWTLFLLLISLGCLAAPLAGQPMQPAATAPAASSRPASGVDDVQISILTLGPGPLIFERYGHAAIRLRVAPLEIDACFDWGNFSFDDPGFFLRFVRGDMRYWMAGRPTSDFLPGYLEQDRTIVEQVLNLTAEQKRSLWIALRQQDTDENRYYFYDYYKDNCSTRIRDVIDDAIGGQLRRATEPQPTAHGYRWHNRRLLQVGLDNRVLCTLMDFLGGPRIDVPLSQWEVAFLPTELAQQLDALAVSGSDGTAVPLVRDRRVLNTTRTPGNFEPTAAANVAWWVLLVSVPLTAAILASARWWRTGFFILAAVWETFVLLFGLVLTLMTFFTRHWPVAWNANMLHFTPLALLVLVAILWRRQRPRLWWASIAAVLLSVLGAAVTISPLTSQLNGPATLLALPLHVAVAIGLRRIGRSATEVVPEAGASTRLAATSNLHDRERIPAT